MKTTRAAQAMAVAVAVVVLVGPVTCGAQEPVVAFDQLRTRLKPGDTVWVTDTQGREIEGTIRALSPTSVLLDAHGKPQDFSATSVHMIDMGRTDPLRNGVLWGALLGFVGGAASCGLNPQCAGDESGAAVSTGAALVGAAAGAGIGALIDGAMAGAGPRTVVYRAAPTGGPASPRISLAPIVTRHAKGLRLAISF